MVINMGKLLSIENLSVIYISDLGIVNAVDKVNISLDEGEVLALVGESGSGKSTLGLTIMRLLPHNAKVVKGRILFRDIDILRLPENEIRR